MSFYAELCRYQIKYFVIYAYSNKTSDGSIDRCSLDRPMSCQRRYNTNVQCTYRNIKIIM